jgi:hypothetical protein
MNDRIFYTRRNVSFILFCIRNSSEKNVKCAQYYDSEHVAYKFSAQKEDYHPQPKLMNTIAQFFFEGKISHKLA